MKKFIINSVLFFFGIGFIFLIGILLPNNSNVRSIDYSLSKKHELLTNEKNNKIILTGGSNVLFGFNSKTLSDSLNIKVINHSIHAGYGMKYILDDVEKFINKGDVLLLSPEYSHFLGNSLWGKEPLLFSLTAMPKNIKLLSLHQYSNMLGYIPKFSIERIKTFIFNIIFSNKTKSSQESRSTYGEFAINNYGDNDTHWKENKHDFKIYDFDKVLNNKAFEYLSNFEKRITEKGGELIIVYPSLCKTMYNKNKEIIKAVNSELEKNKSSVIGSPQDFIYEDDLFFDSPYHLNGKGVTIRTKQLLSILQKI